MMCFDVGVREGNVVVETSSNDLLRLNFLELKSIEPHV